MKIEEMVEQIETRRKAQRDRIKSLNQTVELYILSDQKGNIVYKGDNEEKMFEIIKLGDEEGYTSYLFRKQKGESLQLEQTDWRYIDYGDMQGYWDQENKSISLSGKEYLESLVEVMQRAYKEK